MLGVSVEISMTLRFKNLSFSSGMDGDLEYQKKSIIAISHLPQDGSVHSLLRHQFFEPKNSFFFPGYFHCPNKS